MSGRISVFVTSYNQKDYLIEAIESLLGQTLRPFEIIIADDCSSDGSQAVIERYARKHPDLIRPFYHKQNLGIPRNKSFAMSQVRGDLVTYLDGDDRYLPTKLERELETLLKHPEAQIVYSNVRHIDVDGHEIRSWANPNHTLPSGNVFQEVFSRNFPRRTIFRHEIVYYKWFKEVGFYDPNFAMYHDWELRIRLTKHCRAVYCPEILSEYRIHGGGISKSEPARHLEEGQRVYITNCSLLEDLSKQDRVTIEKNLSSWKAHFVYEQAKRELEKGNCIPFLWNLLKCWFYHPPGTYLRTALPFMLPRWAYPQLRALYRAIARV
jgi:glycosyltransferase involved in cell wall biosynthesis